MAGHEYTLVDDTYNANPDSVRAAIEVLAGLPGPRLLVLGDMGEVGDQGPQLHAEAGEYAKSLGIETLFALGELSQATAVHFGAGRHFADVDALKEAVLETLPGSSSILVKGSRFMKMERVVEAITAHSQHQLRGGADGPSPSTKAPLGGSAAALAANVGVISHAA